ncbi:hypothetical protein [Deinococcus sp.]|uniref:hypothetical protein n=1 Tax=Deinococcus sp. TaxID=47478 RepID=UPI0025F2F4FD|nr:hypothetical protein [Deinococcus sp.]
MKTLQGRYTAEQRNGGYYLKILEDYGHHSAEVSKDDWKADLEILRETMTRELDPRVEVNTQAGKMLWRFAHRGRDSNTGASAYFQGRAQTLLVQTAPVSMMGRR